MINRSRNTCVVLAVGLAVLTSQRHLVANALSVTLSVQGNGQSITQPATEGRELTLTCAYSLGSNEQFTSCIFRKPIPSDFTDNGQEKHFACSTDASGSGSCVQSSDSELSQLTNSISISDSGSACVLRVNSANPKLRGSDWTCRIVADSANDLVAVANQAEVFISNQSEPIITQPDVRRQPTPTITYSLAQSSPRIQATCTAFGGIPAPTFHWYVDNVNGQEILEGSTAHFQTYQSYNTGNHVSVQNGITFTPSLNDLCNTYQISKACDVVNGGADMTTIVFNLICTTQQQGYYQNNNNNNYGHQLNQVSVEFSGSLGLTANISLFVAALSALKFLS